MKLRESLLTALYRSAADLLAWATAVREAGAAELRDLVSAQTEAVRVVVSGPGAELDQVRGHLEASGGNLVIHYAVLDTEAALLGAGLPAHCRDTHVTILPVFTVPNRYLNV